MRRSICVFLLIFTAASVALAQPRKAERKKYSEDLMTSLTKSRNLPGILGDDGVFVNTALQSDDNMPPEIRSILNLGPRAIPLLINHLDDTRLTRMVYCCFTTDSGSYPVTVGDVSQNILGAIVRHMRPLFDMKCEKEQAEDADGLTVCLEDKYGLSMPAFYKRGKARIPTRETRRAKQNWLKAFRSGRVKYQKF